MNLDLSKFKKIESDDKCTVLAHPSGHKIKIAHKGISPEIKKQIESLPMNMAKGGMAKYAQKFDPNMKGSSGSKPSKSSNKMPGSPTEAKNAFTEPDAMGTSIPKQFLQEELHDKHFPDVVVSALNKTAPPFGPLGSSPKQHYPPCINPSCKSYGRSHPNCRCYGGISEHTGSGEAGHFAEGGEVEKEYYCDNNRPHFKNCEYYAGGGEVKGVHKSYYDDGEGGESKVGALARNIDLGKQRKENAIKEHHRVLGEMKSMPDPKIKKLAGGGGVESDADKLEKAAQEINAESQNPTGPDNDNQEQMSSQQPAQQDQLNPNPEMASNEAAVSQAPVEDDSPVIQGQAQDVPDQVVKQANIAQNTHSILANESQQVQQDLNNGHIAPKTYSDLFANKSVPGKIGTLFGLLFSGMGSGLTHQPNMLMQMMDNEINRDLDAQQKSVSNKQTFMQIANQTLKNQAETTGLNINNQVNRRALAWSYAARNTLHDQVAEALKLPEGPQRQQRLQALAILSQGIDKKEADMFSQAGLAQALQESAFGNQSQGGQPNTMLMKSSLLGQPMKEMGEDIEQKTIPGIHGLAQRPIPQSQREQVQSMNVLDNKAKDLIDYAKAHEGSWNPKTRAIAQQKANEMVGFYSSSLGTSMTEGTRTWLDDQIAKKNPTSAIAQELYGSNARLKEIQDSNKMRQNTLLGSLGFNPKQSSSGGTNSPGPQSKSGRPMIQKNGKWYYR